MTISSLSTTFGAFILISVALASQHLPAHFLTALMKSSPSTSGGPPKQVPTVCSPEHYGLRLEELTCNEDYIEAVEKGIEESTCENHFFADEVYENLTCDHVLDNRRNVGPCSSDCSVRVFYYYYCTYLWEDVVEVNSDCGVNSNGVGF